METSLWLSNTLSKIKIPNTSTTGCAEVRSALIKRQTNETKIMLSLNFNAATEQALNTLAQTEERSIEQVLIEALQLYREAEKLENQELNKIADVRLCDGQAFIRVSLNDL